MTGKFPGPLGRISVLITLAVWAWSLSAAAQAPEEGAQQLLENARRAVREHNDQQAADRYREFLQKYPQRGESPAVRLALARIIVQGQQRDYSAALELLAALAQDKEFAEQSHVLYLTGVAQRALGEVAFQRWQAKPEDKVAQKTAHDRFGAARVAFAGAAKLFAMRAGNSLVGPAGQTLPDDLEWAYHAKCDEAEMLFRLDNPKAALAAVDPLLAQPRLSNSRFRTLVLYHHGHAAFLLNDPATAFHNLSQLAPFKEAGIGPHARYLLARMHDLADERPEASLHYEAILTGYENDKKSAQEALRNPNQFRDDPEEKLRLESLTRNPAPEYVRRCGLYLGLIAMADGRHVEAAARLSAYLKTSPAPPADLANNAKLHLGMAQVLAKQYSEAAQTLNPLLKLPGVEESANAWIARAYAAAADPKKGSVYQQDLRTAIEHFQAAISVAGKASEAGAKQRIADLQLELGDALQAAGRPADAVALYRAALKESPANSTGERMMVRLAGALHAAGQFAESDLTCRDFERRFSKSGFAADVAFRSAENAFQRARQAAAKDPKSAEALRCFDEAVQHVQTLLVKYPEFPQTSLARFRMAMAHYERGQLAACAETLAALPDADRVGEMAIASYVHADCLLRTVPSETTDAIAAGHALEQLADAIKQLNKYTAGAADAPNMPEALLKLGSAQLESGALIAEPQERTALLTAAKQTFEKFSGMYQTHPLKAQMYVDRSRSKALLGDIGGAMNDLVKFQGDPYRDSPMAPLAFLRLAGYLRQQNRLDEALKMVAQCLDTYEAKTPTAEWVPAAYSQRAALLKELNRLPEARELFTTILQKFPNSLQAHEGLWRVAQCRREELPEQIEAVRKVLNNGEAKPEEKAAAKQHLNDALAALVAAATECELAAREAQGETIFEGALRQWYEAAWCRRAAADFERQTQSETRRQELLTRWQERLAVRLPAGQNAPDLHPVEIALGDLPAPPSEILAMGDYAALIKAAPNAPLSIEARLELAELHYNRANYDRARRLAQDALDGDVSAEQADRLTILSSNCLLAKGDYTAALDKLQAIAANVKNPFSPEARYRMGEARFQQHNWQRAAEQLLPFRDQGPLQNIPQFTNIALFRLGQAQYELGLWDQAKLTLDNYVNRVGDFSRRDEARYLAARTRQQLKQWDDAILWYQQVAQRSAAEVGARAQLGIGQCRLEQKRYHEALAALSAAANWYDYADSAAEALLETARVHHEMKNNAEASKTLQLVIEKYPKTPWAESAKQRLTEK